MSVLIRVREMTNSYEGDEEVQQIIQGLNPGSTCPGYALKERG